MTPERLDEIRIIYQVSRLAAPDAAVTKALEELIALVELMISWQGPPQFTRQQRTNFEARCWIPLKPKE